MTNSCHLFLFSEKSGSFLPRADFSNVQKEFCKGLQTIVQQPSAHPREKHTNTTEQAVQKKNNNELEVCK